MVERVRSRILVVEEDSDISGILSRELQQLQNTELIMLQDNGQVLGLLKNPESPDFHLVCLDHGSSGVEELTSLASQIRRFFPHIALTVRSNSSDKKTSADIINGGLDDFYSKHEGINVLATRFNTLLNRFFFSEQ